MTLPDQRPGELDPTVSVIIAAYNAENFVGSALRSVIQQDYTSWECIVVDDASQDTTAAVLQRFAARDPRIRIVRNETNQGAARSRNAGIRASRGRYLAFLDSDDVWLETKLSAQVAHMQRSEAAFTYTAYRRISENGDETGPYTRVPPSLGYWDLLGNTAIVTSSVMLDRAVIDDICWPEDYSHEDFALWLSLLRGGIRAIGLDADLLRLRTVRGSLSGNKVRSAKWVWRIYRERERLDPIRSLWFFANYAVRAWFKRRPLHLVANTVRVR